MLLPPPPKESEQDSEGMLTLEQPECLHPERIGTPDRLANLHNPGDHISTPLLQSTATDEEPGTHEEPELRTMHIVTGRKEGPGVVDRQLLPLERTEHPTTACGHDPDSRCIKTGLGCHIQRVPNRWHVVSGRMTIPHKLPGVEGSIPRPSGLCHKGDNIHILLQIDNTTAIAYVNKRGALTLRSSPI